MKVARDSVPALAHQYRRRAPPAFHRKGHGDGVAEPGPATEAARFDLEAEWSQRNNLQARGRRDKVYSSTLAIGVGFSS